MIYYDVVNDYDLDLILSQKAIWKTFPDVKEKTVFIKPNLVTPPTYWDTQSITNVVITESVIKKCIEGKAKKIIVGCCGFKDQWESTIELSDYERLSKQYNIDLVCVQKGENYHKYTLKRFEKKSDYLSLYGIKISDFFLDADIRINLPKLKVHSMALITGAIKNTMGVISPKGTMHPKGSIKIIHKRLRDLYKLMDNYVDWTLMDGIIGAEFNEVYGVPKRANILFSGIDMFEIDVFAAGIMGIDFRKVGYLKYILNTDHKTSIPFPEKELMKDFELPMGWK